MRKLSSDVWTGLRTVPARAGLVLVSLSLGVFAATILFSTLEALRRQARELVRDFGAESFALVRSGTTDESPWSRDQIEFFRANLGAEAHVSGIQRLDLPADADFAVVATDANLARARGWRFVAGRALDELDIRQGARHAMAPAALCLQRNWRVGEIFLLGHEPFRLVGCFDAGGLALPPVQGQAVFIPYTVDALESGRDPARLRVEALWFRAAAGASPELLRRRVDALLAQPGTAVDGLEWITPESLLQGIRRWQRIIAWTAGSGSALGLLLGAVTLAGLLLTGVRERIPEIGLRRALGARRREIAGLFVAEALALAGVSAGVGMAAAEVALRILGGRFPLPFHFGWETRLLPLALALGLALLCSIGPASLAARLPPAEALRND
jgi:putative ABC transport system permease protein